MNTMDVITGLTGRDITNDCDENDNEDIDIAMDIDMRMDIDKDKDNVKDESSELLLLQDALSLNLKYSSSLEQQLNTLRIKLFENLEKQRLLKCKKMLLLWSSYSTGRRCAVMRRGKLFDSPHFIYIINKIKNVKGNEFWINEPFNNKDTNYWLKKSKIKLPSNECIKSSSFKQYLPIFHKSKNISRIEKNVIIASARCEYIEKAKKKLLLEIEKNDDNDIDINNKLRNKLLKLDQCAPIEIDSSLLDWNRICNYFIIKHKNKLSDDIQMVKHREVNEYEIIWKNYILCDNSSWNKKEIEILNKIIIKNNGHNWLKIHNEFIEKLINLNIYKNRTCLSLFKFYQQSINKIHTKQDWTRNDDEILIIISKKYGENDHMSQSFYLDRRLPHQCAARLQHATGTDKVIWNKIQDLILILITKSFTDSKKKISKLKNTWSKAREFIKTKNDSQCRERYNNYLKFIIDLGINSNGIGDILLNIQQIIFIITLLINDKYNLWLKWCDISYILNWYEYNYWYKTYEKWKIKQDLSYKKKYKNIKNVLRKTKLTTKYSKEILQLKKDKIQNHKYFKPSMIAYLFSILFGGKSGYNLFCQNHDYPQKLLSLFKKLKYLSIKCQINKIKKETQDIIKIKKEIESLVNDDRFKFDKLIKNVITETIYFDDKIDSIQNYKRLYKLENRPS